MRLLSILILFAFFGCTNNKEANKKTEVSTVDNIEASDLNDDYLEEARKINHPSAIKPTTKYRKGHASPREKIKEVNKKDNGYEVKLPGNYPIPTPAYYKNKLYVSGGFGSKTYYCFDAASGKNIWAVNLDDDGPSTAVIEDDIVVFNTESCTLFALDANNGKMLWSWWLGDPLASSPTIHKGKVYTTYPANAQGHLQFQGNAQQLNLQNFDIGQTNEPEVKKEDVNNKAKVAPSSHILGCFDLKTGKILWQKWVDGEAMSAPVIEKDQVYITTFPGTVYRFAAGDGKILAASKARATSAPTIVGNQVLYSKRSDNGKGDPNGKVMECLSWNDSRFQLRQSVNSKVALYLSADVQEESQLAKKQEALDAGNGFASAPAASGGLDANGNIGQYRVSGLQSFQGSRALFVKNRVFSTMGDELICSDSKKVHWKLPIQGDLKKLGGFMATPPVAAGDELIIATIDGRVLRVNPDKGKVIKKYKTKATIRFQPTVVDGRIFIGTQEGKLITINTNDLSLTGWPMWGKDCQRSGKVE